MFLVPGDHVKVHFSVKSHCPFLIWKYQYLWSYLKQLHMNVFRSLILWRKYWRIMGWLTLMSFMHLVENPWILSVPSPVWKEAGVLWVKLGLGTCVPGTPCSHLSVPFPWQQCSCLEWTPGGGSRTVRCVLSPWRVSSEHALWVVCSTRWFHKVAA